MSRSVPYRRDITDACNWHQEQALNSTIYILYQTGPTGFLLNEEGESKKFKVFLGDVHNCTCSVFKKEKDLCKHICWIILKKFRIPRDDPLSWQLGLNEREINQFIRGDAVQTQQRIKSNKINSKTLDKKPEESNGTEQRPISESDICPICQDELLAKKLPVSYCRTCGNNVHIKCMKVWAEHQKSNGETELKCPLCRDIFCTFDLLDQEYRNNSLFKLEKEDLHYGLVCQCCKSTPISGKCYKCTSCNEFYLCQPCFNTDFHKTHTFVFREKINQKYRKANRDHVGLLPQAIVQSLENRDLSEQDYDLLLQLDPQNGDKKPFSSIPEKVIKSWKHEKIRDNSQMLNPGVQCRICLRPYQTNQLVRKLPSCKHKFHLDCIDNWLLHSHPTCPIDGQVVWDPITAQIEKEEKRQDSQKKSIAQNQMKNDSQIQDLSLGIIINYKKNTVDVKNDTNNKNTDKLIKLNKLNQRIVSSGDKNKLNLSRINNLKIEIEGHNLNLHHNELLTQSRTILPKIESKKLSKNSHFIKNLSLQRSNSLDGLNGLNFSNNIINNNLFNIQSLIGSKPYQLSRHVNQSKKDQSDFYDYDEDEDDLENYEMFDNTEKIEDYESIRSNLSTINKIEPVLSRTQMSGSNIQLDFTTNEKLVTDKPPHPVNNLVRNRIKMKRLAKMNSNASNVQNKTTEVIDFPLVQGFNLNQKMDQK